MTSDTLLQTTGLIKRFGGISAVNDVSLKVYDQEIHAIIGPNGAGKTTLISLLCGELLADQGQIFFKNQNVSQKNLAQRSRLGLARSFQITSIILPMTLTENLMLAIKGRDKHAFSFWIPLDSDQRIRDEALTLLEQVDLIDKSDQLAAAVSHGEQRQLELAMALAMKPKLLLLDEPMAGMGRSESEKTTELLRLIGQTTGILLIEHDMDAVFSLAKTISVLVNGQIVASDKPDRIRGNADVQRAYLGEPQVVNHA